MKKIIAALLLMLTITTAFAQGEAKTWTAKIDLGAASTIMYYYPEANDQILLLDLGIGYNLTKNIYFGLATFVEGPVGNNDSNYFFPLPVLGDITFSFPNRSGWTPYIQARGGYVFNPKGTVGKGDFPTVDACNYALYDGTAGLLFSIKESISLRFGASYQRYMRVGEGEGHNLSFIAGKLGILFHF